MKETERQIRQAIEALEERRYEAMVEGDLTELDRLLGPELVYIHSSAIADNKDQYLESLRSGDIRYQRFERSDVRIHVFGDATAAISGRIKIWLELHGQQRVLDNLFTNLWVREAGGPWRFVSWQSTPVPR